jgi:quercetin dioxygenase-like cupin family protein
MKNVMFQTLVYQYAVNDWEEKKHSLQALIDHSKFQDNGSFETDRTDNKNGYLNQFVSIIQPQLAMFQEELGVTEAFITDVWTVKYKHGDFHPAHTHSSHGYSGVLYLEYDDDEHSGTYFVNPTTDPVTDLTNYSLPTVHEGAIVIVPSNVLHFTYPNKSNKIRIVMGFDLKFKSSVSI